MNDMSILVNCINKYIDDYFDEYLDTEEHLDSNTDKLFTDFYNMHKDVIKELSLLTLECTVNYVDYAKKQFIIKLTYYNKKKVYYDNKLKGLINNVKESRAKGISITGILNTCPPIRTD